MHRVFLPTATKRKCVFLLILFLVMSLLGASVISGQETQTSLHTLEGHRDNLSRVIFSPTGHMILTTSFDSTAMLWNVETGELLYTLEGHTKGIYAAAFSPGGQTIVTGSSDNSALLWDAATGEQKHLLSFHRNRISAVAFSPDGTQIVTASHDGSAVLWDVESGDYLNVFSGHADGLTDVKFSPDGKTLLTGSIDHNARLWDVRTGRRLFTLEGHGDQVTGVAFSSDGLTAFTAGLDRRVIIWDVKTGTVLHTLDQKSPVVDFALSPDGTQLFAASQEKTILWSLQTHEMLGVFTDHKSEIEDVDFSPDGQRILSISVDGAAVLTDVQTGRILWMFGNTPYRYGPDYGFTSAAFSPDGQTALTTDNRERVVTLWDIRDPAVSEGNATLPPILSPSRIFEGTTDNAFFSPDSQTVTTQMFYKVSIWDVETGAGHQTVHPDSDPLWRSFLSSDGRILLSGSVFAGYEQPMKLWDTQSGDLLHVLSKLRLEHAAFSPDTRTVATVNSKSDVEVWDIQTGERLYILDGKAGMVIFSPDGSTLVTALSSKNFSLWNAGTGELQETVSLDPQGESSAVQGLAFAPDRKTLVLSFLDRQLVAWNADANPTIRELRSYGAGVAKIIEFSPDGSTILLSTDWAGDTTLIDAQSGEHLHELEGQEGALSDDGTLAITGIESGWAMVWNVSSGAMLCILRGHSAQVTYAALSPDGMTALTSSDDHRTMLWDIRSCTSLLENN